MPPRPSSPRIWNRPICDGGLDGAVMDRSPHPENGCLVGPSRAPGATAATAPPTSLALAARKRVGSNWKNLGVGWASGIPSGSVTPDLPGRRPERTTTAMSDSTNAAVQACLDRLRAGDGSALPDLLRRTQDHLARLARRILRDYPEVQRWEQTDDVLQEALVRLCDAVKAVRPA